MVRWRTGRKNGRTIYVQRGTEPDALDAMIGAMDTERMSRLVVDCVNRYFDEHPGVNDYGVEPRTYKRTGADAD